MFSAKKKVIVRSIEGAAASGYLPGSGFVTAGADGPVVELLDLEGRLVALPLGQVRTIAFVRDFNLGEADPERLVRSTFLARPRSEGLWVRLQLVDGLVLEGLAALSVGLLDGVLVDRGLHLMPPDTRSNTQRLFVPRSAIAAMQVLGVITTPSRKAAEKKSGVVSGDLPFGD